MLDAHVRPAPDVGDDLVGVVVGIHGEPIGAVADDRGQSFEGVVDERDAADRAERLRSYLGQRAEPGPGAGGEDDAGEMSRGYVIGRVLHDHGRGWVGWVGV